MLCELENCSQRRKERSTAHSGLKKISSRRKHHHGRSSNSMEDEGEVLGCHHKWRVNLQKALPRGKENAFVARTKLYLLIGRKSELNREKVTFI